MSPRTDLPARAARHDRADFRSSATAQAAPGGRRPNSSPEDELRRLQSRFDYLIRDVELGARSQREHERMVDEAETIANELRGIFRRSTSPNPSNPPLAQAGGKAWW